MGHRTVTFTFGRPVKGEVRYSSVEWSPDVPKPSEQNCCRTIGKVVCPNMSARPKPAERIVIAFSCFALYMAYSDSF